MTEPTWMIVELMGRKVVAGLVREETRFGTAWLRIDIPDVPGQPGFTSYYGSSALYGFRPVDEATARAVAAKLREPPVEPWRVAQLGSGSAHDSVRPGEYEDDDESVYEDQEDDAPLRCEECNGCVEDGRCLDCGHRMAFATMRMGDDVAKIVIRTSGDDVELSTTTMTGSRVAVTGIATHVKDVEDDEDATPKPKVRLDRARIVIRDWGERLAADDERSATLGEQCFRVVAQAQHDDDFFVLPDGRFQDTWWAHLMHACNALVHNSDRTEVMLGFADALRRACFDASDLGLHMRCCPLHGCIYSDWYCPVAEGDEPPSGSSERECCAKSLEEAEHMRERGELPERVDTLPGELRPEDIPGNADDEDIPF